MDADADARQHVTKSRLASGTSRYLYGATSLTYDELAMIFDYINLDMSGALSTQELEVQLSALPEVESADRVACHKTSDDAITDSPLADNVAADDHEATQEFDDTRYST